MTLEERDFLHNPNEAAPNDSKILSVCEKWRLSDKMLEIAYRLCTATENNFKTTVIAVLNTPLLPCMYATDKWKYGLAAKGLMITKSTGQKVTKASEESELVDKPGK